MREWLVSNGIGGYASLTHTNTNTRKYHGLLIASLHPPTQRWMFVSNLFTTLIHNQKPLELSTKKPEFSFDLFPKLTYTIDDIQLTKTICMPRGKNTTLLKYDLNTKTPVTIVQTPLVNSRHIYDLTRERYLTFKQTHTKNTLSIQPENSSKTLTIKHSKASYEPSQIWQELYYQKDKERQEAWIDNNILLGNFICTTDKPLQWYVMLTIESPKTITSPSKLFFTEKKRKKSLLSKAKATKNNASLILAADQFLVNKEKGKSIIAGYHWFGDWGRDTLIALPGITLVTKRYNDAKTILKSFSAYCKDGLIPNVFMERDSQPAYNTVDASLWYIDRVFQYLKYTNDQAFLKEIYSTLEQIMNGYKKGTHYDIHMDDDFLISHGPGLTWMDVKLDTYYPTPRNNKAVEIQALWYNALCIMSILAQKTNHKDWYAPLAQQVKSNFTQLYDQFYDVIDTKDTSLRPNQIFLVSLDFSMIPPEKQRNIVTLTQQLHTIFGLRTLIHNHPNYKGVYIGNYNRDLSYHNGIAWTWLLGPFITAFLKTKKYDKKWREYAHEQFLQPIFDVMGDQWDGQLYEIFDGDSPYIPRGCIAQAWSVAEILRTMVEDIEYQRPPFEKEYMPI